MSKKMNQFKQRMVNNQGVPTGEGKHIIEVEINNDIVAKINYKTYVNKREITELVKDMFVYKKHYKKDEVISFSKICDTPYDLRFLGTKNNIRKEAYFTVC